MIRVIHHQRLPYKGQVSIERLFNELRNNLGGFFSISVLISPMFSKGFIFRLVNLIYASRQKADVHHIVGDVHYLAFGLSARKLVLTIHDCSALNRLTGWRREILRYFWFIGPMRRASVVTTISEVIKEELRHWVGPLAEKVIVIPNCVSAQLKPHPKRFQNYRPVVLQVGTGWNKNVERVAESLIGTGCVLEVVGELSADQRTALNNTNVPFKELGRVSDGELLIAYERCDFVVFASLYEGFGLPIIEAQAIGRPVITSNCSSMPEVAGDGALFVDPESVISIREGVRILINNPELREDLVQKGFRNVLRFCPGEIAAQYAAIYGKIFSNLNVN